MNTSIDMLILIPEPFNIKKRYIHDPIRYPVTAIPMTNTNQTLNKDCSY